jgi:hypothetical protein
MPTKYDLRELMREVDDERRRRSNTERHLTQDDIRNLISSKQHRGKPRERTDGRNG